jgi:hypothetical protein
MNDTFYIIYKLTNIVNNKIYIGAHVTKNVNDEYMGSGNGVKEHFIDLSKKQEYLNLGFIAGRLKTSVLQKRNSLKVEV